MTYEYKWLNKDSRKFLERDYLETNETPEQRIEDIANTAEKLLNLPGFANKFCEYMSRGFYSLSTPIWANFGRLRGLPISCFGSYIPDDIYNILFKFGEIGAMSAGGGGTSAYFGDVRSRGTRISSGGRATGVHHQLTVYDSLTNYVSQGNVRRGSFAAYLPVDHPDIEEFLKIKSEGDPIQELSFGVCVSDEWMKSMIEGDKHKRKLWGQIIKRRFESGYPYIFFSDNVNNNKPQVYKDKNLTIHASNLCTEIFLPTSTDESFVCDLSSINLEKWDEIIETDAIETLIFFLDSVMTEFITKTQDITLMQAARKFAINHRALGLGVLGWHSYLQSKLIPFESMQAKLDNNFIWKTLRERTDIATQQLAIRFGEPPLLKGYNRRNTTTLAIAPTTSSSFILGQVSPSIEPLNSNYFVKDLAKGKFTYKNPYLEKLLKEKGKNDADTWKTILIRGGSAQHLDFLTREEKDAFKTFSEISQKEIVIQAAQRQKYIDQGQSLNIMIPPETKAKEVNELMIFAWEQGIKSLYYQRSANPAQELARSILTCSSCEG
jgi:ribonucleoside-diphosphate reductase alpha chain